MLLMYYRIFCFDIGLIDPRLQCEGDETLYDEDFLNSFDSYPRA
jgi:hypothetical protein